MGMGAALSVRRTIQMSLCEYDNAVAALLTAGSPNAVRIVLPSTLARFLHGTPDGRNPLFRETTSPKEHTPSEAPFALPSCRLAGRLTAAAGLAILKALPEDLRQEAVLDPDILGKYRMPLCRSPRGAQHRYNRG